MTLNDATQEYANTERARILKEAARFNGNVDVTVEKLEETIETIFDLQSKLYVLTEEDRLNEKEINEVLEKMYKAGVKPAIDPSTGMYRN
ncbi:MAG: hypothetical protein EOO61_01435 [Hymenobacter sp.]|nr:MAG: hypothetical protein EOO61_01435 [Hymenobacter sp.]